jgi:hypothetical protein
MDERDGDMPSPEDSDQEEFKLTGEAATAQWRRVRRHFYAAFVVAGALLLVSLFLWHRTVDQLGWIGLGLSALSMAVLIWTDNLVGYSYPGTEGPEATFTGKRPLAPRELASPVLFVAGILLVLAGSSTGPGRALATVFSVIRTLYEAGKSALGLLLIPLAIVIIAVLVGVPLLFVGWGIYFLIMFVLRGFRPDPENGTGVKFLAIGLVVLAFESFITYEVVQNRDLMMNEIFDPFRTIIGWFS